MAYLSKNHKGNGNQSKNNSDLLMKSRLSQHRNTLNKNGFKNENKYKNNNGEGQSNYEKLKTRLSEVKQKQKRAAAKKAITTAANAAGPVAGAAAKVAVNTPKGEKYIDAYAKADNNAQGIANVKKELKKDVKKAKIIMFLISIMLPLLLIILLFLLIFKNSDSQIYSNKNGGTVKSDDYIKDDKLVNIFANYPGLYEKIAKNVNKVSDEYKIEIDRYLIIATLIAPIQNELIIPVEDNSCGEPECYYFNGESKTWTEFLEAWGDQSELLAKMQIKTFTNPASPDQAECGDEQTEEQFAKNDMEVRKKYAFWWLNPLEWFRGFKDATQAELNAVCTNAPSGKTSVPTVYTHSMLEGEYYTSYNENKELDYVKDENSGGVYFWNLVNKNGFLYEYLKDYLSDEYKEDEDKNYEINKNKIIEIANYIYAYYDSITKSCEGHRVLESTIKTIKVAHKGYAARKDPTNMSIPHDEIDFEEQYIGGVMLAEFSSSDIEGLKAFAILVRTEAIANVGLDGSKIIENSSNVQNYNPNYSPEKYPKIAQAVKETRGMVLTKYKSADIWHTEYDAFCPVKSELENGFYYLPDGQQNLPINPAAYTQITGKSFINPDSEYLDCPCFQNVKSMPSDKFGETRTRYVPYSFGAPTDPSGTPRQATKEVCWNPNGKTAVDDDGTQLKGWIYHATGGHGRGASQYGIKYLDAFGYSQDAILRIFFPGAQVRLLSSSLEDNKCANIEYYTGDDSDYGEGGSSHSGSYTGDSNYNEAVGGSPLNKSLEEALAEHGNTIEDLNNCIAERVNAAGYGTRAGVVEAGMGLIECTMDLTGGYTYPYDHTGGRHTNADLNGKLGVNSDWGKPGGTGCKDGNCRLGLNCATFVRWAMCNGGMDLCDKGSTFAHEMYHTTYFPEAIKLRLSPGFQKLAGNTSISSTQEALDSIKPGDVLYSDRQSGGANHVMLVVGTTSDSITIAENGRKTRIISKSSILSPGDMQYGVLLLDDYFDNSNNMNDLSW